MSVVVGILVKDNKILIAQRSRKKNHPLKWEFPGGKVLKNEGLESALIREFKEELSIKISIIKPLIQYKYSYKRKFETSLHFFKISDFSGSIKMNVHESIEWVNLTGLLKFDFLDGDMKIINYIINNDAINL